MIRKLAIFVEGLTEQEFTIRLLTELAGKRGMNFEIQEQYRGTLSFRELRSFHIPEQHHQPISILVANCRADNQVKSQIIDNYKSLTLQGYSLIVGLRDVYPFVHDDIKTLEEGLLTGLPIGSIPIHIHLAIMEIEAWFLEEMTHFKVIDSNITSQALIDCGFDYENSRAYSLHHPTEILEKIYQTVGKGYGKNLPHIKRTVEAISYEELYLNTCSKAPSLNKFIASLENGLFSTA
jgi:hypothetical protein